MSTLFIVLCHVIKYYTFIPGSAYIGQFFNVGVQVFLIISGYLYGTKVIDNYISWLYKRVKRICLPVFIVVLVDVTVMMVMKIKTDAITFVMYLLNLQGLLFLNWNFFGKIITEISNLGPLWFTTIIMLCYLSVPILQSNYWGRGKALRKYIQYLAIMYVIVLYLEATGIVDLSYIFLFIVGYTFGSFGFNENNTCIKDVILLSFVVLVLQIIRVLIRIKFPSFECYSIYVTISHAALGIWLFYIGFAIEKRAPELVRNIAENRVVLFFDLSSYFIYLIHGLFCRGPFNVYLLFDNLLINTLLFVFFTLIIAFALQNISKVIVSCLP